MTTPAPSPCSSPRLRSWMRASSSPTKGQHHLHQCGRRPHARILGAWHHFPLSAPVPLAEVARTGGPIFIESREDWVARYPALVDSRLSRRGAHAGAALRAGPRTCQAVRGRAPGAGRSRQHLHVDAAARVAGYRPASPSRGRPAVVVGRPARLLPNLAREGLRSPADGALDQPPFVIAPTTSKRTGTPFT